MVLVYLLSGVALLFWLCCVCWSARCTFLWRSMNWSSVVSETQKGNITPFGFHCFQRLDSITYSYTTKLLLNFLGIFFIFPFRVLILLLFLPFLGIVTPLSLVTSKDNQSSWPGFAYGTLPSKLMARFISFILFFLGLIVVDNIPFGTLDLLPKTSCIVSNHVSALDILYFMSRLGFPCFVAKASTKRIPFIKHFVSAMGCICIDRNSIENRNATLKAIQKRQSLEEKCTTLNRLVIFPEGTTSNGRYVLPFKRGAFTSLRPVTAVVLFYPPTYFHPAFDVVHNSIWLTLLLSSPVFCRLYATWIPYIEPVLSPEVHPEMVCVHHYKIKVHREILETLQKQIRQHTSLYNEPLYSKSDSRLLLDDNQEDPLHTKNRIKELCFSRTVEKNYQQKDNSPKISEARQTSFENKVPRQNHRFKMH